MNIGIKTVVMITLAALLGWSASTMAKAAVPNVMTTEYVVAEACTGSTVDVLKEDVGAQGGQLWKSLKGDDLEKFKNALVKAQQVASIQAVTHVGQMDFYVTEKNPENVLVVTARADGCVLNTFIVPRDLTDQLMKDAFGENS